MSQSSPRLLHLYVELVDSHPPIWRSFQVPDSLTLADLHRVLQGVMGWSNVRPHVFRTNGERYGDPTSDVPSPIADESTVTLAALLTPDTPKLLYTYDPQNGWLHRIELDQQLVHQSSAPLLRCLDGERACPPEFCTGVWGYEELLERLADIEAPDYEDLLNQIGLDFDPEAFNVAQVNQRLSQLAAQMGLET